MACGARDTPNQMWMAAARPRLHKPEWCAAATTCWAELTAAHLVDHVIPHVPVRQWVLSLPIAMARELLCCDIDGFSLHAAVRVDAHERKRLEQLCRYITRPALADERVQLNDAGQVELKLKTQFQWRLTCTQVMS